MNFPQHLVSATGYTIFFISGVVVLLRLMFNQEPALLTYACIFTFELLSLIALKKPLTLILAAAGMCIMLASFFLWVNPSLTVFALQLIGTVTYTFIKMRP